MSDGGNPSQSLNLSGNFPAGVAGSAYNAVLNVSGGSAPYRFAVKSGSLADGLTLNPATGSVSGTPVAEGSYSFEVMVTDALLLHEGIQKFVLDVGKRQHLVKVSVSPASATMVAGQKQQFTATVSGTKNTAVTWSATEGSIDAGGLYTAPTVKAQTNIVVTAVSSADPKQKASASLTVDAIQQSPTITNGNLPPGQLGNSYSQIFSAAGGAPPYAWSISAGSPPAGITLTSGGTLSGLPTTAGISSFSVSVKDSTGLSAQRQFSVDIVSGDNFDGPAELPRATVDSSMASTPAPGAVINVSAGGDLQSALNSAQCGDTIQLQAGATFSGKFILPAKACDSDHWIILRTSAADNLLPNEGQRVTPCYAGVASLTGRPQYACANPQNVLARLKLDRTGDGAIKLADGANHYRMLGLEIMRADGISGGATLVTAVNLADHIVLDRSWLHGGLQDETHNGFSLSGTSFVAVVDSYFSDFHCISRSGTCSDSHAVAGGVSNSQDGPYKIENNFLEASGEAVMFGGGPATTTPTDIQVLHNHFFKPWQWMKGQPGFIGGVTGDPFIVKNHLELKNAIRVLIEGNLMENSWGGFSQTGFGILLTPKNQHTQLGTNVCPICQVTDVTVRYTQISHAGGGISMATAISGDGTNGAPALAGARWSIHDVVLDDLSRNYVGGGAAFEIMNAWPTNGLNTVTIDHVTAFPDPNSHLMVVGNQYAYEDMYGFVFTNNLVMTGRYPVWNTGGGTTSCGYYDVPIKTIVNCFKTYTFKNNALAASPAVFPPSTWPAENYFPATTDVVGFVNFNGGNGGNYALTASSPYKNKGMDGRDLGADTAGLNAALAGVE